MIRTAQHFFTTLTNIPDRIVDPIGMYRVVTLGLFTLTINSFVASVFGWIAYEVSDLLVSLVIAVGLGLGLNVIISKVLRVPANHESALITALIVFLLMIPNDAVLQNWQLVTAVSLGVISKYLIAFRRQHFLNPAAVGMVLVAFGVMGYNVIAGTDYSSDIFQWWVANPSMFWVLLIVGSLVVFKIRRWPMVLAAVGAGAVVFMTEWWFLFETVPFESGRIFLMSFPVLFLAFFMLTEPFTTPPTKKVQVLYGGTVGILSSTIMFAQIGFPMTPELALVLGNLAFYPTRLKQKLYLKLLGRRTIADQTIEYEFEKPEGMKWQPGQYLEWMLPHKADSRGPRRYFTIASAPEESTVKLALRVMPEGGSSYKKELEELEVGESLIASQLAGDFLLPPEAGQKIAMVAGGIGVTPFRSHIGYLLAKEEKRDVALYYCNKFAKDIAYKEEFAEAEEKLGLKWVNVLADEEVSNTENGYLTKEIIERHTPDYKERVWYLSGPPGMVNAYEKLLRDIGVPRRQVVTDFFPGLA